MRPEEDFDSFYRSTREDLLHQAFLLTGDVRAASGAVRDAYVTAWQHWTRANRDGDPLAYTRPLAWRHAQRRHRGRIWHRNRGISDSDRNVLDALHKLPASQRRVLLLVEVARLDLPTAARESALTVEAAGLRLQSARQGLSEALSINPQLIGEHLAAVGYASTASGALPRTSIVMRAGQKRRRVQAAALVAGTLSLTLAAGAVANQPGRHRPGTTGSFLPSSTTSTSGSPSPTSKVIDTSQLVGTDTMTRLIPGSTWKEVRTDGNTAGTGLNSPCQTARFADPQGVSALVRLFKTAGKHPLRAVETVETSRTVHRSVNAYKTMTNWFGACRSPRTQLTKAYDLDGVGEQGQLIYLTTKAHPDQSIAVAIVRTGTETMSLAVSTPATSAPKSQQLLSAAAEAVRNICGANPCVDATPVSTPGLPKVDTRFGLLAAIDLPPVGRISDIWIGTEPARGKEPPATAACSTPRFRLATSAPIHSRTFLIPQASLPTSFGLVETTGVFGRRADAAGFANKLVASLRTCAKKDFTANLTLTGQKKSSTVTYSTWFLRTRVSRQSYLNLRIAVIRNGLRVALIAFTPAPSADMSGPQFNSLALRASQRLAALPPT